MPHFLFQWTYKDTSLAAMVRAPHDRSEELRKAVAGFGGKMLCFYYAFGEHDGCAIVEFPDHRSCAACSMALAAGGAAAAFKTTTLLSPDEGWQAMRLANEARTGYLPPQGYSSHG